ncbi:MAG: cell division protein FtsZ [Dehalococcoidia bacterium]
MTTIWDPDDDETLARSRRQPVLPGMDDGEDDGERPDGRPSWRVEPPRADEIEDGAGPQAPGIPRHDEEHRGEFRRESVMSADYNGLPPIKVIGVGGGGCNAVDRMIDQQIAGVEFVGVNTDQQALARCQAPVRLRIGDKLTKGLGVGGDPERGHRAAEESRDELQEAIRGAEMVFITAGMGGGTGTGASPLVAEVARDAGALTVGVVTKPFQFEGNRRRAQAEEGVNELRARLDTLIAIPNDRLLDVCGPDVSVEEAFRLADDVLLQAIQGISELITLPGEINLDFADVRRIMQDAGPALLAIGRGAGGDRAAEAARAAIASPLLDVSIDGAMGVLFNVTGSRNLGLHELHAAAQVISEVVSPDAEIIFGTAIDSSLGDEVKVTVIATGIPMGLRAIAAAEPVAVGQQPPFEEPPVVNPADTELPAFLRRTVVSR